MYKVRIEDNKVYFEKSKKSKAENEKQSNTDKQNHKSLVGDDENAIRKIVKEEIQKSQNGELDNMMERLSNIENQGSGGTCQVHSTTILDNNLDKALENL